MSEKAKWVRVRDDLRHAYDMEQALVRVQDKAMLLGWTDKGRQATDMLASVRSALRELEDMEEALR